MGLSEASSLGLESVIKPRNTTNAIAGLAKASVSATTGAPGTVTSGSTTAYVFKGSGSITFNTSGSVEILVVAGGGGGTGGSNNTNFQAPGGGGGGVLYVQQAYVIAGSALTVTVGAGGSASTGVEGATQGNFSSMGSYYAIGGGCGLPGNSLNINGVRIGGSGAGGAGGGAATVSTGASGVTGQGNAGGNGATASTQGGGGGGGAGGVGGNAVTTTGGAGGVGVTSTILASADATAQSVGQVSGGLVYYGGGGGGYGTAANGAAGLGGGGGTTTANGTANTGGGGRGQVGTGGSGVVIVKVG